MNTVFEYYLSILYGSSIIFNNNSNCRYMILSIFDANLQSFPDLIFVEVGIFGIQDTFYDIRIIYFCVKTSKAIFST